MTDASTFLNQGLSHAETAVRCDRIACESLDPADFDNAKDSYFRASEYFFTALKYERNERRKAEIRNKISSYLDRVEIIKEWLKNCKKNEERLQQRKTAAKTSKPSSTGNSKKTEREKERETSDDDREEEQLQSRLGSAILAEKPDVKWGDVAGLEGAKDALKEAVILPQKFPQMFTGKRRPWKGILLYGPPGTGKSYLAKAVATEADAKFFSISSSDLVSKWQGESEKLVKQLFTMARNAGKAIIFIDEIDALVSTRSSNESESSRRIKTEFLVQMDGVGKSSEGVLLLGATNIPWGLDDALLRRMERRVYIPLPDVSARARMFELHMGNTPHELGAEDFKELGMVSEGYSGSDIKIVCRDAMMQPVRTIQNASFFKYVMVEEDGRQVRKVTPCSPGDKDGVEMKLMSISSDELVAPAITRRDFEMALMKTKPSVGKAAIMKHVKFTREKGQSGV